MRVLFLRDDRTFEIRRRDQKGGEAFLGPSKGLYVMDPRAIQPYMIEGMVEGAEIIFFESSSSPVPIRRPAKNKAGVPPDPSTTYLDNFIYKNALEQTGDPQILGLMSQLSGVIRPLLEGGNFVKIILFLLILQAVVRGLMAV